MLKQRKGTLVYLRERFDRTSAIIFFASFVLAIVVVTLFCAGRADRPMLGICLGAFSLLLICSFVRPIISMAADGYEALVQVVLAGWLLIIMAVVFWYGCYYLITDQLSGGAGPSKILDVPTLIVAIGAATTGWYVSFQLTRRSHRTTHAVSLVLGSRTNSEFQKNNNYVRQYLPTKECVDALDNSLFESSSLKQCCTQYFNTKTPETLRALKVARAIEGLKYMLNYYEFMAVGIKLGDIEESIVYETISPHVVGVYDRSKKLRDWMRGNDGKQILVFEHLEELVGRWRTALNDDENHTKNKASGKQS